MELNIHKDKNKKSSIDQLIITCSAKQCETQVWLIWLFVKYPKLGTK
jgi:hypothetical protein